MNETSSRHFGLIVAYLLPGFVGLVGMAPLFPAVADWLRPVQQGSLGFGPPIYALLSAIAIGLIVSCFRWLLLDQTHHWMGVRRPAWDDSRLDTVLSGFDYLVQSHFRYYEFTGNMLVASLWVYGLNRSMHTLPFLGVGTDLGMLILSFVLFAASRDALAKYYTRTGQLVGKAAEKGLNGVAMFNGNHAESGGGPSATTNPQAKPVSKPEAADKQPAASTKDGQKPRQ
jgi:hypothetical protein